MATQDGDWSKPQAMAIPKGGYFERKEGEVRTGLPQNPGMLWIHDHRETQAGARGRDA